MTIRGRSGKEFFALAFGFLFLTAGLDPGHIRAAATADEPRPGETAPIKGTQLSLYRDDEMVFLGVWDEPGSELLVGVVSHPESDQTTRGIRFVEDFENPVAQLPHTTMPLPYRLVRGRFSKLDYSKANYEQAIVVYPTVPGTFVSYLVENSSGTTQIKKLEEVKDGSQRLRGFGIAAVDIDQVSDGNGFLHDEIVLVRAHSGQPPQESSLTTELRISILDGDFRQRSFYKKQYPGAQGPLDLTTGDFDGDGWIELIVGLRLDHEQIQLMLYEIDSSGARPMVVERATVVFAHDHEHLLDVFGGTGLQLASGDLNGDGQPNLAFANENGVQILEVTRSKDGWQLSPRPIVATRGLSSAHPPTLVSGLFKFDPGKGLGLDSRQLLRCGVTRDQKRFECDRYAWDRDWGFVWNDTPLSEPLQGGSWAGVEPVIASGNLYGHGLPGWKTERTDPTEQVYVSYVLTDKKRKYLPPFELVIAPGTSEVLHREQLDGWPAIVAAIPYDWDGDSYSLGDPVHLVFEDRLTLSALIEEPPKHVDYLPMDPSRSDKDWGVVNVSGGSQFYVELKDMEATTFGTEAKSGTSWTISGGVTVKAKEGFGGGDPNLWGASVYSEQTTKIGYQYDQSESQWNSEYHSSQSTYTSRTDQDDFLAFRFETIDLWRYPVLGLENTDPDHPAAFVEIALPGPKKSFQGAGMNFADWYQPTHQNKNLLSYPNANRTDFPADLGVFTAPNGNTIHAPMNKMDMRFYDGVSQRLDLSWTEESGGGDQKSWTHKLGESAGITAGFSANWRWGAVKVEASGSMAVSFNNENSWSGLTTTKNTSTKSQGIAINKPVGDPDKAYAFKSAVYVSEGSGTLRVSHAVDPVGSSSGRLWWKQQYGRKADPALNLPNRFVHEGGDNFELNKDSSRMEMRGFILREGKKDSFTGEYEVLAGPPKDGDVVRLCARVYNFALEHPTGEFDVLFEIVPIDRLGEEKERRKIITSARTELDPVLTDIDRVPMKEVCVEWDTRGFYRPDGCTYRFYVTVDPKNEVDELHEWKDKKGNRLTSGNNEGFWKWGSEGTRVLQSEEGERAPLPGPLQLVMTGESLALETDSQLVTVDGVSEVEVGRTYSLRAHLKANRDHPDFTNILFTEGPPDNERVLGLRRAGIGAGDNYSWARWTPREPGTAVLKARVLGSVGTAAEDAGDSLVVKVRGAPAVRSTQTGSR